MDYNLFKGLFTAREQLHDHLSVFGQPGDKPGLALLRRMASLRETVLPKAIAPQPSPIDAILRAAAAPLPEAGKVKVPAVRKGKRVRKPK